MHQLSCEQVTALLSFYVEDKLSDKLTQYVREHLEQCPQCMEKYVKLKNMFGKFMDTQNQVVENPYINKQYEDFKSNLSAYVDNELNDFENIRLKKIAISNPLARQDLENIYTFKKLLHSAFEKTKNDMKTDYSKSVLCKLSQDCSNNAKVDPFIKLTILFFVMVTFIVAGMIYILYF